jgi:NitT/TauT family transport system ATP-binding protein
LAELIEARNVSFSYRRSPNEQVFVLRDFTLSIHENECFCLLGPSGCGKTTALRLVAGFNFPDSGSVTLQGREITGPGPDRGVVFQGDDSLFNWLSALDNVAFGLKMQGVDRSSRLTTARKLTRLVGLDDEDEKKYPAELSGGMKQRIQIARVLATDPKILLMDEPFGALDAQTRAELQDEFVRIWTQTGKTTLFITHDISEAILLGDRIGVMSRGPGATIREILEIETSRPRSRAAPEFGRLYEQVNSLIRQKGKPSHVTS